jgi:hypothetical protein
MFLVVDLAKIVDFLLVKPGHPCSKRIVYCPPLGQSMDALKSVLTRYVDISKRIGEANQHVNDLRDHRRTVELDLAALYGNSREQLPDTIELKSSEMIFKVKRPNEWKKGWSLSKKELKGYLLEILPEHGEDLMKEIERRQEAKMVETDFGFELKAKN